MPDDRADETVKKVEEKNAHEGAKAAYGALKEDYEKFKKEGHTEEEAKAYWDKVTAKLDKDKVLPELAVAWGAEKHDKVAREGNIKNWDLDLVKDRKSADAMDVAMSDSLQKQFDSLKKESNDGFLGLWDQDGVSKADLTKHMDRVEAKRQEDVRLAKERDENSVLAKGLMGSKDGNEHHTLFEALDRTPGGGHDGKIDKGDLNRYLEHYKTRESMDDLGGAYNPENKQFVENLLKNWDGDAGVRLRGTHKVTVDKGGVTEDEPNYWLTKDSIAKSVGMQPDQLVASYADNKAAPEVQRASTETQVATADSTTPKPGDTTQQSADSQTSAVAETHRAEQAGLATDQTTQTTDKPAGKPGDQATDKPAEVEKDPMDDLPKATKLEKGKVLWDIASASLRERAQLTGEATDKDAIFREVNRIMVLNGYPDANIDGKSGISMRDLPSAWNHVSTNQEFHLYDEQQLAEMKQKAAQKKMAAKK